MVDALAGARDLLVQRQRRGARRTGSQRARARAPRQLRPRSDAGCTAGARLRGAPRQRDRGPAGRRRTVRHVRHRQVHDRTGDRCAGRRALLRRHRCLPGDRRACRSRRGCLFLFESTRPRARCRVTRAMRGSASRCAATESRLRSTAFTTSFATAPWPSTLPRSCSIPPPQALRGSSHPLASIRHGRRRSAPRLHRAPDGASHATWTSGSAASRRLSRISRLSPKRSAARGDGVSVTTVGHRDPAVDVGRADSLLKGVVPLARLVQLAHRPSKRTTGARTLERNLGKYLSSKGRFPFRPPSNCLERSLGAYRLLCGVGANPSLVIGVNHSPSSGSEGARVGHGRGEAARRERRRSETVHDDRDVRRGRGSSAGRTGRTPSLAQLRIG